MSRREEIQKESKIFYASSDDYTVYKKGFEVGAEWADEHPRKGLVDKEKVEQWIIGCFEFLNDVGNHNFKIDKFIDDFRKAMEE